MNARRQRGLREEERQNAGGAVGNIAGNGAGGVVYNTSGADYAEYFAAEELVPAGYLVGLDRQSGNVRRWKAGDPLVGIVSAAPGFVGNKQYKDSKDHILVSLVGQVELKDANIMKENGLVKTTDGQRIGYSLSNGKVLIKM